LINLKIVEKKLNFPVVIKPINEGSSVKVFICQKKNFLKNLKNLRDYDEILIEKFIPGREIQVAILGNQKLGAIELKPKRKFYDYKAKYNTNAKTQHIIKIDLPKKKLNEVLEIAHKAHKIIRCKGVTRSDFKYFKGKFYLLEINTQPGMTPTSLSPEQAKAKGISFDDFCNWILEDASCNR